MFVHVCPLIYLMCQAGMYEGVLRLLLWCVSSGVTIGYPHHRHSLAVSLSMYIWPYGAGMSCVTATKGKFTPNNLIVVE